MSGAQTVEPGKLSGSARILFNVLAVAAFILGVVGFRQYLPGHPEYGRSWLDLTYYSLQLFVLDAAPLQTATGLPLALQIARFIAPLVTAYLIVLAVQSLIRQSLAQARIALIRGHSILCGPEELTGQLAAQIRRETGGRAVIVSERTLPGSLHVAGDPRQPATLVRAGLRRARELITVGPDSVRNAEVAIAVHAAGRAGKTAVTCYAEASDRDLFRAVVAQETSAGEVNRLDLFDRHDRTARALLDHLPPFPPADPRSAVLVIGYAGLGRVLTHRLVQVWSGADDSGGPVSSLCVLDRDVPAAVVTRRHRDPRGRVAVSARRCDVAWLTTIDELRVPTADGADRVPGRVYVCVEDDAAGIAIGNAVLGLLSRHDTTVVVAVQHSGLLGDAARVESDENSFRAVQSLGSARLIMVNVSRTVYTMAAIRTGTNEELAKAIHQTYLRHVQERGDSPETNPSVRPWAQLPDFLKDSNREQAWDIGHKLTMVGLTAVPRSSSARPVELSDAEIETLAKVEHRRWLRERTAKGWRPGAARDDGRKLHPDLTDWKHLSEESRDKDRSAVRSIPAHLARAGLTIVRTTADGKPT